MSTHHRFCFLLYTLYNSLYFAQDTLTSGITGEKDFRKAPTDLLKICDQETVKKQLRFVASHVHVFSHLADRKAQVFFEDYPPTSSA